MMMHGHGLANFKCSLLLSHSLSRKIQNQNIRLFICIHLVSFHIVTNFDCIVNKIMVELTPDQN